MKEVTLSLGRKMIEFLTFDNLFTLNPDVEWQRLSRFPAKNNASLYVRALLKVMLHGTIRNDDF